MQQACQYLSVNLINPHNLKEERPTGTPQRSKKDMYLQNLDYRIFFFFFGVETRECFTGILTATSFSDYFKKTRNKCIQAAIMVL